MATPDDRREIARHLRDMQSREAWHEPPPPREEWVVRLADWLLPLVAVGLAVLAVYLFFVRQYR